MVGEVIFWFATIVMVAASEVCLALSIGLHIPPGHLKRSLRILISTASAQRFMVR